MWAGQGVASAGLLRAQSSVVGQNLGLERPHGGPWVVWTPWGCGNSPLGRGRAWGHVLVRPWGVRGGGGGWAPRAALTLPLANPMKNAPPGPMIIF